MLATNVVSEFRKRRPNPGLLRWIDSVRSDELFLSVLTIGELRLVIEQRRRKDPAAAEVLESWLGGLTAAYGERIVGIDEAASDRWGRMNVPDRVPTIDGLLAATALSRSWTLVTRNVDDVKRSGVRLLNPFDDRLARS